ncbi:MAG: winged helix-turn-helix domain-containing protein [Planctomycetota bacterium]
MATVPVSEGLAAIGEVAGKVWHALSADSPMSYPKLTKEVGEPRDLVMQAVGWLAREGKVEIEEGPRGRTVALLETDAPS